ncbi:MAG: hypothetical protein R3292_03275 [Alcanivorax sp.]|nr:hypothetical protein [Alcanivorax sp.]
MKLSIFMPWLALAVIAALAGCVGHAPRPTGLPARAEACPAARPQVCTMDYRPAFGYDDHGGIVSQFANACAACADSRVAFTLPAGSSPQTFAAPPAGGKAAPR